MGTSLNTQITHVLCLMGSVFAQGYAPTGTPQLNRTSKSFNGAPVAGSMLRSDRQSAQGHREYNK